MFPRHLFGKSPITIIVLLSVVGGVALWLSPPLIMYGMWNYPSSWEHRTMQYLLYSFLHGGFLHVLSNSLFFLFIGNIIEITHGKSYIIGLWIFTTLTVGTVLLWLSDAPTIGGSGFAMAILGVYTLDFYRRKNPEYKGGMMLIGLNILVGIYGNVSLLGHLVGVIAGLLYDIFYRKCLAKNRNI